MLPSLVLRRMILTGLNIGDGSDPEMEDAKEFIYEGLKTFDQADLASRLTLSSLPGVVSAKNIHDLPVTIIDVFNDCSLTQVLIQSHKCNLEYFCYYFEFPGRQRQHL